MSTRLEELAYMTWLKESGGYVLPHPMGDGRWCAIMPLMFHWTLHIGQIGDRTGYDDRYCLRDRETAEKSLLEWAERGFAGEPEYWHRHPLTGRRREDGDPSKETINF